MNFTDERGFEPRCPFQAAYPFHEQSVQFLGSQTISPPVELPFQQLGVHMQQNKVTEKTAPLQTAGGRVPFIMLPSVILHIPVSLPKDN